MSCSYKDQGFCLPGSQTKGMTLLMEPSYVTDSNKRPPVGQVRLPPKKDFKDAHQMLQKSLLFPSTHSMLRDADSPLDLSVKTRKRCADTTFSDVHLEFLRESSPLKKPKTGATTAPLDLTKSKTLVLTRPPFHDNAGLAALYHGQPPYTYKPVHLKSGSPRPNSPALTKIRDGPWSHPAKDVNKPAGYAASRSALPNSVHGYPRFNIPHSKPAYPVLGQHIASFSPVSTVYSFPLPGVARAEPRNGDASAKVRSLARFEQPKPDEKLETGTILPQVPQDQGKAQYFPAVQRCSPDSTNSVQLLSKSKKICGDIYHHQLHYTHQNGGVSRRQRQGDGRTSVPVSYTSSHSHLQTPPLRPRIPTNAVQYFPPNARVPQQLNGHQKHRMPMKRTDTPNSRPMPDNHFPFLTTRSDNYTQAQPHYQTAGSGHPSVRTVPKYACAPSQALPPAMVPSSADVQQWLKRASVTAGDGRGFQPLENRTLNTSCVMSFFTRPVDPVCSMNTGFTTAGKPLPESSETSQRGLDKYYTPLSIKIPSNPESIQDGEKPEMKTGSEMRDPKMGSRKHIILSAVNQDEALKKAFHVSEAGSVLLNPVGEARSTAASSSCSLSPAPSPKMPILSPQHKNPPRVGSPSRSEPPSLEPRPATFTENVQTQEAVRSRLHIEAKRTFGNFSLNSNALQSSSPYNGLYYQRESGIPCFVNSVPYISTFGTPIPFPPSAPRSATDCRPKDTIPTTAKLMKTNISRTILEGLKDRKDGFHGRQTARHKNIPVANVAPIVHSKQDKAVSDNRNGLRNGLDSVLQLNKRQDGKEIHNDGIKFRPNSRTSCCPLFNPKPPVKTKFDDKSLLHDKSVVTAHFQECVPKKELDFKGANYKYSKCSFQDAINSILEQRCGKMDSEIIADKLHCKTEERTNENKGTGKTEAARGHASPARCRSTPRVAGKKRANNNGMDKQLDRKRKSPSSTQSLMDVDRMKCKNYLKHKLLSVIPSYRKNRLLSQSVVEQVRSGSIDRCGLLRSSGMSAESYSHRQRRSMLSEIADSDGYVGGRKRENTKTNDLYADPSLLGREERALQRAMIQFDKMEKGERRFRDDHIRRKTNTRQKADELKRKALMGTARPRTRAERRSRRWRKLSKSKPFVDFQPEVLDSRTRNQAAGKIRRLKYNRNAAYERELKKEEFRKAHKRAKRRRARLRERRRKPDTRKSRQVDNSLTGFWEIQSNSPVLRSAMRRGRGRGKLKMRLQWCPKSAGQKFHCTRASYVLGRFRGRRGNVGSYFNRVSTGYGRRHVGLQNRRHLPISRLGRRRLARESEQPKEANKDHFGTSFPIPPEIKKLVINKNSGETVLHRAARLGYEDVTLYCLETRSVDVNTRDNAGYTPLHECCVRGNFVIAQFLLAYGADVNRCSQDGIRPIHDAVENDHIEMVRLLLSYGADPTLVTYGGKSPIKIARSTRMTNLLKNYITDLNGGDEDEMAAWEFSRTSIVPDSDEENGFDIFSNVPSDPEEEDVEDIFHFTDCPYMIYTIGAKAKTMPRECILLSDVLDRWKVTAKTFREVCEDLEVIAVRTEEFLAELGGAVSSRLLSSRLQSQPPRELLLVWADDFHRVKEMLVNYKTKSKGHFKPPHGAASTNPAAPPPDLCQTGGADEKPISVPVPVPVPEGADGPSRASISELPRERRTAPPSQVAKSKIPFDRSVASRTAEPAPSLYHNGHFTIKVGAVPEDCFQALHVRPKVADCEPGDGGSYSDRTPVLLDTAVIDR